jgi:hypothetical protein
MGNVPASTHGVMDKVRGRRGSRSRAADQMKGSKPNLPKDERVDDFVDLDWQSEEDIPKQKASIDQHQHDTTKPSTRLRKQSSRRKSRGEMMMASVSELAVGDATGTGTTAKKIVRQGSSVAAIVAQGNKAVPSSALQWSPLDESAVHESISNIGGIPRLRELLYCFYTQFNFEKVWVFLPLYDKLYISP